MTSPRKRGVPAAAAPAAGRRERVQTTVSTTSTLPRVAFEYGQTSCAAATSASAAVRSMPGTETAIETAMPKAPVLGTVMRRGYRLGEQVLRHAMVAVVDAVEKVAGDEASGQTPDAPAES